MYKRSICWMMVVLLSLSLCVLFTHTSKAATMVYFDDGDSPALSDIAAFQFDILSPSEVGISDFNASWPGGWFDFSTGKTVNAFDGTGSASLSSGMVGSFSGDVVLGNWVLGNQAAESLDEGVDYMVFFDDATSTYTVGAPRAIIPIPGALYLLFSGLLGLIGIRRRMRRS